MSLRNTKLLCSHAFKATAWLILFFFATQKGHSQTSSTDITHFEVASIRPAPNNDGRPSLESLPDGSFHASNVTLKLLIEAAYGVRDDQVSGGEGWMDRDQFVIAAKAPVPSGNLTTEERNGLTQERLQNLLADRFSLVVKRETKKQGGYALTADKAEIKMEVATDSGGPMIRQIGRWQLTAERVRMSLFVAFLGAHLHDSVVDETGLTEHYNFKLNWTPDVQQPRDMPEDSLIPAIKEQLGLKLKTQKVEIPFYTVQSATRPTEN